MQRASISSVDSEDPSLKALEELPLYAASQPRRRAAKKAVAWGEDMEDEEIREIVQDLPATAALRRRKPPRAAVELDLGALEASLLAHAKVQRALEELSLRVERRQERLSRLTDEAHAILQLKPKTASILPPDSEPDEIAGLTVLSSDGSAATSPRVEGSPSSPAASFWSTCLREGLRRVCQRPSSPDASGGLPRSSFEEVFSTQLASQREPGRRAVSFAAYFPEVFRSLRLHAFSVSEDSFMQSMCEGPLSGGQQGEGKSGMLFFSSWDKKYLVKTVMPKEMAFFSEQLVDYHGYMKGHTDSFLPHFMGLYSLQFAKPAYLVVFRNLFPAGLHFDAKYDLKGVLGAHRYVSPEQRANGVEVLKDRNFLQRKPLRLAAPKLGQLEEDVNFLEKQGRIDYSLLLGVTTAPRTADQEAKRIQTLLANGKVAAEVVYMGIIDILQEYGKTKAMESTLKSLQYSLKGLRRKSNVSDISTAVSSMPPGHYAKRFIDFMKQIFI